MFNITWQLTTGYKGLKLSRWIYLVLYSLWVETRLHFSVSLNSGTFQDIETQSETSLLNALFSHLFFMAVSGASLPNRRIFLSNLNTMPDAQPDLNEDLWNGKTQRFLNKGMHCSWKAKYYSTSRAALRNSLAFSPYPRSHATFFPLSLLYFGLIFEAV